MPTPLRPVQVETREIRVHGHGISYRQAGEGPVMLLVHGIASTCETWLDAMPRLARQFTVIAPDLPGHGNSDKPPGDYSIGALATAMRDLLVALGHDRATIVGHSLGGGVAMQFAYQYPERCERLVLVSSGGLGRSVSPLLRAAALPGSELVLAAIAAPLAEVGRRGAAIARRLGFKPAADLAEVGRGFASLAAPDGRTAFLATLRSVIAPGGQRVAATDRLYLAAKMPTLIVWGERDPIIPVGHGHRAHELMPGSSFHAFPDVGHMPQVEHPHEFADLVLNFTGATKPSHFTPEEWRDLLVHGGAAETPRRPRSRRASA